MKILLLLLSLAASLPAAYASGTVELWKFENSPAGAVIPSALTVTGSPTYVTGAAKGVYWFKTVPASGAFFSWPADVNAAFSSLNNWSVECYMEKYARAANSWIFTNHTSASAVDVTIGIILGDGTGDTIAVYKGPGGTFMNLPGSSIVNKRLHLGVTGGSFGREIWIDGALGASDYGTNCTMPAGLAYGKIGTFGTGGVVSANTYIDDFRVSNVRKTGFPTVDPAAPVATTPTSTRLDLRLLLPFRRPFPF